MEALTNPVIEALMNRRSVRSFTGQVIPEEALRTIAETAVYAPSACNWQTWHFTVVQKPEALAKLIAAATEALGKPDYNMYKPNAVIISSNARSSRFAHIDCACANENMFLAAYSLGIGSVWINQLNDVCDEPGVRAVLTELGVPADHIVCGTVALGYPAAPARKPNKNEANISYTL